MNESDNLLTHPVNGSPRTPTPDAEPNTGPGHDGRDEARSPLEPLGARRLPAEEGEVGQGAAAGAAAARPLAGGALNLKAAAAAETSTFSAAAPDTGRPTSNSVPEASFYVLVLMFAAMLYAFPAAGCVVFILTAGLHNPIEIIYSYSN